MAVVYIAFAKANTLQAQQDLQGKAYFIAQTTYSIKPDSAVARDKTPENAAMSKRVREALAKGNSEEFEMEFTTTESSYEKVVELAKPTVGGAFNMTVISNGSSSRPVYKNLKEQKYYKTDEILGKEFLIVDNMKTYHWQLSDEKKKIGTYNCLKATYVPELTEAQKEAKVKQEKEKETGGLLAQIPDADPTISVWYTPDIPLSNGPGLYQGLPGFILEVKERNTVISCTKIEINPDIDLNIKKPRGGKKINQKDFDTLRKEKFEERMKMQGNDGFIIETIGN